MVPSTNASKENTCDANVLYPTQMLLRIQRNGKELLGTRITHFELLHMLSLHDMHVVCCKAGVKQMGNTNQHNTW